MSENELVPLSSIEAVRQFEKALFNLPQIDINTQMFVHGQMAARAMFIPAGANLIGAETKVDNICVVFGDATVTTEAGPVRLTGFNILPASAGIKRVAVVHVDTWWVTLHHTKLTDLAAIEAEMTDEAGKLLTSRLAMEGQQGAALLAGGAGL